MVTNMRNVEEAVCKMKENENVCGSEILEIDMGTGKVKTEMMFPDEMFYKILSEMAGVEISDQSQLVKMINEMAHIKKEYEKLEYALHDVALILDDNPYTLSILTNRGYTDYQGFFNETSNLIYEFHQQYWKEKINICTLIES